MDIFAIKKYIEQNERAMVEDLRNFIAIPSITEDRSAVRKALRYVLELAQRMGFEAKSVLNESVGVIEFGQGTETIGILSHVDVVPPGDLKQWQTKPFEMQEIDGNLYGRGTLDDKGAIIACLYAMKAVKDLEQPLHKKIQMILGTQEEREWSDIEAYVAQYPLPDYGFTPDGEYPLCNIEKGCMTMQITLPLDHCEKDGTYLMDIQGGSAVNTVAGKCTAIIMQMQDGEVVAEETVTAEGKSVHACQPEMGKNAIFVMDTLLHNYHLDENLMLKGVRLVKTWFSDLYGEVIGLQSESEYYNGEYVHKNVFSPTMISAEEDDLKIWVDIRFAYGASAQKIAQRIETLALAAGGRAEVLSSMPAVYISKERPFMKAFGQAYEEACGRKHEFVLAYGGSYAKAMPNIASWGPIFPGEEDTCHMENEYISVASLLDNGKIFAVALAKIALSSESFR